MEWKRTWPIHLALLIISVIMLTPFYWVVKTSLTGENLYNYPPSLIPKDPHLFYYVDAWYYVPFARFMWNSMIVSVMVILANVVCNAMAGYALTRSFRGKSFIILLLLSCMMIPFQTTIIPAFLITKGLGLLNSHLGLALPLFSTIVCIFVFKTNFDAVPSSILDAAKIDGLSEWKMIPTIMLPLAKPALATNIILAFIWSWNNFLWPLIIIREEMMQTLPLGLSNFLSYWENTTGALFAFVVMVLAPGVLVFFLLQNEFISGLLSGSVKG
jgi:ABC-type glycerol-3-phosphate transport system permease component